MTNKKISFRQANISYTITGKGPTVLLLHGFAEDGTIFNAQVDFLKHSYQLIVPDMPGTGASELLKADECSLTDYATCIKQILDAENVTSCIMIGHSMGGYTTLAFAEKFPALLSAFMLFHSSAFADDEEKITTRKKGIQFIQENGAAAFIKATIPNLFFDTNKSKLSIAELTEKGKQFSNEALIQYYRAMINRPDRTHVLKNFEGSVGFVLGQHDKAVPFEQGLTQTHLPKKSYIYVLRNTAHMGMIEETEKTNDILADFLQNI